MRELDTGKTVEILNSDPRTGACRGRSLHPLRSHCDGTAPNRLPIVEFMKGQASESLAHAQQVGEILTGIGGFTWKSLRAR